jgi:pilus assembly protein CpaB
MADERIEKPSVVRAVTLEVETASAQKLALAASVGTLSLMLRKAGEVATESPQRITLTDLVRGDVPAGDSRFATVSVTRATARQDYSVPVESKGDRALAAATRRRALQ